MLHCLHVPLYCAVYHMIQDAPTYSCTCNVPTSYVPRGLYCGVGNTTHLPEGPGMLFSTVISYSNTRTSSRKFVLIVLSSFPLPQAGPGLKFGIFVVN